MNEGTRFSTKGSKEPTILDFKNYRLEIKKNKPSSTSSRVVEYNEYGFLSYEHIPSRTKSLTSSEILAFRDYAFHVYFYFVHGLCCILYVFYVTIYLAFFHVLFFF